MGFFAPTPSPYDPIAWSKLPLAQRSRMVCEAWAVDGYGTPIAAFLAYAFKIALFIGGWLFACSFSPALVGADTHGLMATIASAPRWWLDPLAFEKAIIWSLLFEVLGLGCGSGPLTGRYFPPVGGFLYFLRPGTTKLPLFPRVPLLGGVKRNLLDVLLYLAIVVLAVRALIASAPGFAEVAPLAAAVAVMGIKDKTIFLAARGEHYWAMLMCFTLAAGNGGSPAWIGSVKAVQLALWFWAGVSKLNHHFPSVISVMTSNGPFTRFGWMRRAMYRSYPGDLRPSKVAVLMGHAGTVMELGVPIAFLLTPTGTAPVVAIVMMLMLHGYITSNVPMGVPLEWNVTLVYSAFALFWAHPDVHVSLTSGSPLLGAILLTMLVVVPLLGNFFPARVSFLMAMRYYAGNWPFSIWLFRGDSYRKLDKLTMSSRWVYDQLALFYDRPTAVGLVGKVMAFRLMHLHGRTLQTLVPKAVAKLEDYEWIDGELVAGLALGWNFGDGHLHNEQLLGGVQEQCGFEEGELRCIFVEPQALFGKSLAYRIVDAKSGRIEAGELAIDDLLARQSWRESA
jgi:hypothetical protein